MFYVYAICYFFMSATLLFVLLPVLARTLLEKEIFNLNEFSSGIKLQ